MVLGQLPDAATPTTIVGAFIFIGLALVTLIGWLVRHVFVTTIPEMMAADTKRMEALVEAHKAGQAALLADNAAQRKAHECAIAEMTRVFREDGKAERELCAGQFAALNAGLSALTTGLAEDRKVAIAEINLHTTEAMQQYRHDMNDTINTAVMGKELAAATARRAADGKSQSS